ncbi:MAG: phenylacetate-CoA oxygenase subunit PaaJ [Gammaproteobacteria bacterium]|nr:phenylacetate-CoA oxygenase subunit PaaJ [Gammaproteobacteria bacterium]
MTTIEAKVWAALQAVPDPEIPVISITDLGIVREVDCAAERVTVVVTPTYAGCPATEVIKADIVSALRELGITSIEIKLRLTPPWTTDWLTPAAHAALREYGIAPPHITLDGVTREDTHAITFKPRCPRCTSLQTECLSEFGATPCKALYRCQRCREPFEYFKPH